MRSYALVAFWLLTFDAVCYFSYIVLNQYPRQVTRNSRLWDLILFLTTMYLSGWGWYVLWGS
jgi:hypothetical protein